MKTPSLVVLVGALVVACLPGLATAQVGPAYEFTIDSDELPPEGYAAVNTSFERAAMLSVRCVAPQGASPLPHEFTVSTATDDEGVQATASPGTVSVLLDAAACASGEPRTAALNVSVMIAPDVPAAKQVQIDLIVTDEDGRSERLSWRERPEPVMETEVAFRTDRFKTGPNSQVTLPLEIRTAGNADVQVRFSLDGRSSDQLNVALPPPVIVTVESGRTTIPVDVQTPFENGYIDRSDELWINVTRVWPEDTSFKQDLGTVNATIETVGSYLPGPSAVAAGAVIVAVLALAARHRPPIGPTPSGRSNLLTTTHE